MPRRPKKTAKKKAPLRQGDRNYKMGAYTLSAECHERIEKLADQRARTNGGRPNKSAVIEELVMASPLDDGATMEEGEPAGIRSALDAMGGTGQ